ncbi:PAS domain S-box-containing protein [Austwickia chelonae]|uniref:PAS/PAC domain-containing protein n=1 Tax=Austwickia chelonae NBRC 105200 TaxID=1184607 RepID=K6VIM1_9MICO|nr:PAS domain-containing protein [Austwickia chelonae]GAB76569.1 PAS/PAC domain-containing protein [Austwickia chelonae NBRC 105200]SEW27059.1 PAS domain S-box-containing protein [Austwickia chelonae]
MSAAAPVPVPRDHEITFGDDELIVSKTDLKGIITYANDVFVRISGYREEELIGAPHNIVRHPDCPAGVFKLLWDTISQGKEIFAYVKNRSRDGGHYWVLAHVTPTHDRAGTTVGYHSSRRCPERAAIDEVEELYALMRAEENRHTNRREAATAGLGLVARALADRGVTYDEYVWDLIHRTTPAHRRAA